MLGVARIPPPICFPNLIHSQPYKSHNYTPLFLLKRTGFCLFAQNKQKNSSFSKVELEKLNFDDGFEVDEEDDDYDDFDDNDLDDVDDDGDDDDEVMVPLHKMDEWLEKKPKGFGEGKVYDTSVEDKLLEELEKIREAQLANVDKLKNGTKVAEPKNELKELKVSEVAPGCVRVRVNNLPKKKNVHRDLKSAFQGVHGIANIFPMVSGTKKTRDPVCKGFAFVDFKSLEDANRFVQLFSGQNISFGKTEKRIKCDILKSSDDSNGGPMLFKNNIISKSRITVLEEIADQVDDITKQDPQLVSWDDDDFDESDEDSDDEDVVENIESLKFMEKSDIESIESRLLKQSLDLLPTKPKEKSLGKKKPAHKEKPDNAMATDVKLPGSSKRLKNHSHLDELDEDSDDEDVAEDFVLLNAIEETDIGSVESRLLRESNESLSTKPKEKRVDKKKLAPKKKPDNATKGKIPGNSKRLKEREKAKLADVYSRYGVRQEAFTSKEM